MFLNQLSLIIPGFCACSRIVWFTVTQVRLLLATLYDYLIPYLFTYLQQEALLSQRGHRVGRA